ncbi:ExbD/TolR family protein [Verrucomicrobiota bacterium]
METRGTHFRRRRAMCSDPKLAMSAMIDVVFLLLIFFVFMVKPTDILAHLDVARPRAGGGEDISMLHIDVLAGGFAVNGRPASPDYIDKILTRISGVSPTQSVIITCTSDSSHSGLVRVLDLCAKSGLENLSLCSR